MQPQVQVTMLYQISRGGRYIGIALATLAQAIFGYTLCAARHPLYILES